MVGLNIIKNIYLKKLNKNNPIVVAVSCGVDSSVLLDLVIKSGFTPIICHVNHHKRKESEQEEKYIRSFAEKNNYKIYVLNYNYQENNFQAEAHDARYDFFINVAKENNASAILTAHHAEDNLETILMNLISGSNLYGYAGIKECVDYLEVPIIRPLLDYKKSEIYEYARENNITYFEDSSNQSDDYERNRIRHHIIPLLEKENPNIYSSIKNFSNQLFGAFYSIRSKSIAFLSKKFSVKSFSCLDNAQQKDIINYMFENNDVISLGNKIDDVLEIILNNKPNQTYDLGNNKTLIKEYDYCYIDEKVCPKEFSFQLDLDDSVENNVGSFCFSSEASSLSMEISQEEKFPLTIRSREYGDKLIIGDGHKKLKDFLIDKKVPMSIRDNIIVVTNKDNEIIWVIGYYKKKYQTQNKIYLNCVVK